MFESREQGGAGRLSLRHEQVLKALIECYIQSGMPVGSKTLSQMNLVGGLSPASIRNVLAELEHLGFLSSPHTSAGRMPTEWGLRYFVDSLLVHKTPDLTLFPKLEGVDTTQELIQSTSDLLSQLTRWVGLVMVPRAEQLLLRHLEFLPLGNRRVLVILVVNGKEVQNRVITLAKEHSAQELQQAAAFLLEHFQGRDLQEARQALFDGVTRDRQSMNQRMQLALDVSEKAFGLEQQSDYVLAGANSLLSEMKSADLPQLNNLFEALHRKEQILALLDDCLLTEGVRIFIGEEAGCDALRSCSIVLSRYELPNKAVGVLGVVGPQRMAYDSVIPIVDATAKLLGTLLNKSTESTI
ncbi:MAG: heat-inducible transcriptional repressor HrcA [Pseudomonadota bacterium]